MTTAPAPTRTVPALPPSSARRELLSAAQTALTSNLVSHRDGTFLSAGQHQFRSFWTRDFCWSVPGLLAIGRADAVRDHLSLLFKSIRPTDGLLPRSIDSIDPKLRVATATVRYAFGINRSASAPTGKLHFEYTEQNGHPVIDGNALAILAALQYADATGDHAFITRNTKAIAQLLAFYQRDLDDDLVVQPGFSDWQDSVKRAGKTFYTNILWSTVLTQLAERGLAGVTRAYAQRVHDKVEATFFDCASGLYKSLEHGPQISMDGNLLAIELGFTTHPAQLYAALKKHPLWTKAGGLPGTVTMPDYPRRDRNWTAWIAGLGHYHDRSAWSWLTAMSAKVAERMGDPAEADRILSGLATLVARDKTVVEIYEPSRDMRPWERWLYKSERPFSWGAAATLDATSFIAAQRAGIAAIAS